jgi:hypothetical protein
MDNERSHPSQDDMVDDEWEECICDISGEDACPVHYPIHDDSDDGDYMDAAAKDG